MQQKRPPHHAYTVGWFATLRVEISAVKLMLDEEYQSPRDVGNDNNSYICGRVGEHNVVITFPSEYGTNSAAQTAANTMRTFPKLRFGLLVGVAGGAPGKPSSKRSSDDIHLGDVVVSDPAAAYNGVIQIDMGKWESTPNHEEFRVISHLNQAPEKLAKSIKRLQVEHDFGEGKMVQYIGDAIKKAGEIGALSSDYKFPGYDNDILFRADYQHPGGSDCSRCDITMTERRLPRETPHVHYGIIASSNGVIKSAQRRDELRDKFNISCFEMAAAGLMNHFPCLVIQGICDYSDSHENKTWQPFAAIAAAAYAKDLLSIIDGDEIESVPPVPGGDRNSHTSGIPASTSSSVSLTDGSTYTIINVATETAINLADGVMVSSWESYGGSHQKWILNKHQDDRWTLTNARWGAYLGLPPTFRRGTVLIGVPEPVTWFISPDPEQSGWFRIFDPNSQRPDLYIDLDSESPGSGMSLLLWDWNPASDVKDHQKWIFQRSDN
ncbi:hypothetical protein TWF730_006122 [Orbilia blumenaviensis]|uniref:Ricin B lectin domain-containing protein n=1 Tax=Orbilia blumenaviensis TaxID=1796055 RepID=A0AAV9TVT9_9PEZI